ncbi:hypothetical protein M378DRAFT_88733, partial [Amanita muscaria Koide BX008]
HWAIPRITWRKMEAEREAKRSGSKVQTTLDGVVNKTSVNKEFSKQNITLEVTKFVACGDQSLAVAESAGFRNCLVAMRPKTLKSELPSSYNVAVCLHNEAVKWIASLKADIKVSNLLCRDKKILSFPPDSPR